MPPLAPAPDPAGRQALGINPVPITWTRNIMAGATYVAGAPGQPGLHFRHDLRPGSAVLEEAKDGQPYLHYICPCGCGCVGSLPLSPMPGRQGWSWAIADDMRIKPTLHPSIAKRYGCRWHGYLTAGVWETHPQWVKGVG